jgi:hypothetical protein
MDSYGFEVHFVRGHGLNLNGEWALMEHKEMPKLN